MNFLLLLMLLLGQVSWGATIAVIDSGVDKTHDMIAPNIWVNPKSSPTYPDAINGWNFSENNAEIFDPSGMVHFTSEVKRFISLSAQSFLFSLSDADRAWALEKQKDEDFMKKLDFSGNFIHGTHVAGIAIKGSSHKVLGIKILTSKFEKKSLTLFANTKAQFDKWNQLENFFDQMAKDQSILFTNIAKFLRNSTVHVANGSFGTGMNQAAPIAGYVFMRIFEREPTVEEFLKAIKIFLVSLVRENTKAMALAPQTLWVFASGNDGLNNDEWPFFPSNIQASNVISVAATYETQFFAPFSNFGNKVDVAAPGMLIRSSVPGNGYLALSGTSQAAPYVSNIAGKVKDINPELTPSHIKRILIETVDKKPFLVGKVASGGIVNLKRALMAAELSRSVPLSQAIKLAKNEIAQEKSLASPDFDHSSIVPTAMPSFIEF